MIEIDENIVVRAYEVQSELRLTMIWFCPIVASLSSHENKRTSFVRLIAAQCYKKYICDKNIHCCLKFDITDLFRDWLRK